MRVYTKQKKMIIEFKKEELKEELGIETFNDVLELIVVFSDKFIEKHKKPKMKNRSFLAKIEGDLIIFKEIKKDDFI